MKKLLLIFFILIFTFNLEAKEYKSVHGFTIQIPDSYFVISDINSAEVVKDLKQQGYDSPFLSELNTNLNFEYFVNINDLHLDYPDEININSENQNFVDIETFDLNQYCNTMQMGVSQLAGKYLEQHICELSDLPGKMIGKSFHTITDSIYSEDEKSEQYQFYATKTQLITISLNCSSISCDKSSQVLSNLLKSMR